MRKSAHHTLRELLRNHPDGLTVKQMCAITNMLESPTRRTLKCMPDVYRDRWVIGSGTRPSAVFIAVHVPDDCPPPDTKAKRSRP